MSREAEALAGIIELGQTPVSGEKAMLGRIGMMVELATKGLEPEPEALPDAMTVEERVDTYMIGQQDAIDRPGWAWAYNLHAHFLEAALEGDSNGLGGPDFWWRIMNLAEKRDNIIKPYVWQTQPGHPRFRTDGMWEGGNIPLESVRPFVEGTAGDEDG